MWWKVTALRVSASRAPIIKVASPQPFNPTKACPYTPTLPSTPLLRQPQLLLPLPRRAPHRIFRTPRRLRRLSPRLPRRFRRLPPGLPRPLNRLIRSALDLIRSGRAPLSTALFRILRREGRRGRLSGAGRDLAQSARYARHGIAEAGAEGADLWRRAEGS